MTNRDKALACKQEGHEAYKKKDFANAVSHIKAAIELDPTEITFYTNLAAVHFETKVSTKYQAQAQPLISSIKNCRNSVINT